MGSNHRMDLNETTAADAPSPYLDAKDVMRHFRCSRSSIYNWMEVGLLPRPVSIGAKKFWTRAQIAATDAHIARTVA